MQHFLQSVTTTENKYWRINAENITKQNKATLKILDQQNKDQKLVLNRKATEFKNKSQELGSLEEKFIRNQISASSYNKWQPKLSQEVRVWQREIAKLRTVELDADNLMNLHPDQLKDFT